MPTLPTGPLSETERSQIRIYMGWPARYFQQHPELQMSMEALDDASEEDRTQVRIALAGVADIDTRLTDALSRNRAEEVGSIKLNPREIGNLRSEGRRYVGRLAAALGVGVLNDSFSGGTYSVSNFVNYD